MMDSYLIETSTVDRECLDDPRYIFPVVPLFLNPKASDGLPPILSAEQPQHNRKRRFSGQTGRAVFVQPRTNLLTSSTNSDNCRIGDQVSNFPGLSLITIKHSPSSGDLIQQPLFNHNEEDRPATFCFGFTKRQWLILCNFALANFFSSIVISLEGPFYPIEAESKGASATEYGLVLGIFELTMFIMSPICGIVIGKVKPRFMFNLGIFTTGACVILFGFLDFVDDRVPFIAWSFIIRIAQACGDSAFVTASFTIIALEFPNSVACTFSLLETCFGLGLIVGPTVGGVLYETAGFFMTFFVVGCCLLLIALLTYFILPQSCLDVSDCLSEDCSLDPYKSGDSFDSKDETESKEGMLALIRIPSVALAMFSMVVSCSSLGFLSATLEPHLRQSFGLTPMYAGFVFIVDGGMYAIFAPMWGKLCDKTTNLKIFTLIGAILSFTGFLFIGPVPYIPIPTLLWVTCLGLAIHGLGYGASVVSAFILTLRDALAKGFDDNVNTYGICSGLWTSAFSLGCFLGPSVGGVLLDLYGFQMASIFVLVTQTSVIVVTVTCMLASMCQDHEGESKDLKKTENSPLLLGKECKVVGDSGLSSGSSSSADLQFRRPSSPYGSL